MNYYWMCAYYTQYYNNTPKFEELVLNGKHPFKWRDEVLRMKTKDGTTYAYDILNWKPISKEEYDLYVELQEKRIDDL